MKAYIYITVILGSIAVWGFSHSARAQISQQIEVTREYTPDVSRADKLDISPQMTDTLSLRPEVYYNITPMPWEGVFETRPMRPVRIDASPHRDLWPFYVRAGAGAPGMTLLDIYATTRLKGGATAGAYLNHYGQYAELKSDMGVKLPAGRMNNRVGGYFNKMPGKRNLDISVDFDNRSVRPFGAFALEDVDLMNYYPESIEIVRYNDISAAVSLGDLFMDFSHPNWKLGVAGNYFSDNSDNAQAGFMFDGAVGFGFGRGKLLLDAGASLISGKKQLADYGNAVIEVAPRYEFSNNKLSLRLGAHVDYVSEMGLADNAKSMSGYNTSNGDSRLGGDNSGGGSFKIFPDVAVSYRVAEYISAYAVVDGGVEDGSFGTLTRLNPYVVGGAWLRSSSRTGIRAGFSGTAFKRVNYDISGGIDLYENYQCFANIYMGGNTTRFMPLRDVNANIFHLGASLKIVPARGFDIDLVGKVYGVERSDWSDNIAVGVPDYEFDATISWAWRKKIFIRVGGELTGARDANYFVTSASQSDALHVESIPEAINLTAGVEFRLTERFNIFVEAENILNQRIYRFNHYPVMGINILGGVKIVF